MHVMNVKATALADDGSSDIHTYVYCTVICTYVRTYTHSTNHVFYIEDPPINDVIASTNRAPSDLSGFDIFIMWTVSGFVYVEAFLYVQKHTL